jgi:hypothetical protein
MYKCRNLEMQKMYLTFDIRHLTFLHSCIDPSFDTRALIRFPHFCIHALIRL